MHQIFDITRTSRKILSQYLDNHSLEQLNKVPEGLNNNLIWNIAHIIVIQQRLAYKASGLPLNISKEMEDKYNMGSRPLTDVTEEEVEEIRSLLFETINQTKADYNNGVFKNYYEFTNGLGFTIRNIEDALSFNNYHEATHLGIMMTIKKFI